MQDDEDEYELDIDALDPETCWKLQAYVDGVMAAEAAKLPGQAPPPAPPAGAAAAAGAPPAAAAPVAPLAGGAGGAGAAPAGAQQGGAAAPAADGAQRPAGSGEPGWRGVGRLAVLLLS
mgnify:CR=1 FL=1